MHPPDARGGRRVRDRRAHRPRGGADHRGPRPGPRPVPRGRLVRGPAAGAATRRSCRPTRTRTARCSRGCARTRVTRLVREPEQAAGRAGFWGLDSAAPLVAGTYAAGPRRRGRRADDGRISSWAARRSPTACAGRPGTTPPARCTAATASSTTRRSPPKRSSRRPGERVAIIDVDYHHGNGSQQIFWRRGDVRYVSIHARPAARLPVLPRSRRRDRRGRGGGREPQHPASRRRDQRGLPGGRPIVPSRRSRRARVDRRRVARVRHLRTRSDRRLRADDRGLSRGRAPGRGARASPGHPPGGRLSPAVARRERPGVAARRRGPALRSVARRRVRERGAVAGDVA